jgi:hypothetical protein
MVFEVAGDRQLTTVQGGIAEAGEAVLGRHLQGDEVAPRTGDEDLGVGDAHTA